MCWRHDDNVLLALCTYCIFMFLPPDGVGQQSSYDSMLYRSAIGLILLSRYLMNGLNNLDKTYSSPTNELEVKGQGHSRPEYVVTKSSTLTLGRRRPFCHCVYLIAHVQCIYLLSYCSVIVCKCPQFLSVCMSVSVSVCVRADNR